MFITVKDALKLPSFSTAKVAAGEAGLRRRIYRVSVVECPEFPLDVDIAGRDNLLFSDGEFLITSFYAIKDNSDMLLQTIKLYNQFNSSGICIMERYYREIPQAVIDYANSNDYPIITVSRTTSYGEMISDITKAIYTRYNQQTACDVLDQILGGDNSYEKVKKLAYTLNAHFRNNIAAFCIKCESVDISIINRLNIIPGLFCVNYYDKIIALYSSSKAIKKAGIENVKKAITEVFSSYKMAYHIGIGNIYSELYYLKDAIENASIALNLCQVMNKMSMAYDDIGLYKLLMKIPGRDVLKEYYDGIVNPVLQYDMENKGNLFDTMMCYVENNGDYKKTASELYQHENTIRYRMAKIKALLNREDNDLQFSEDISLAYKLHMVLKRDTGEENGLHFKTNSQ
jgi:Regulator of polyketide synthase expression